MIINSGAEKNNNKKKEHNYTDVRTWTVKVSSNKISVKCRLVHKQIGPILFFGAAHGFLRGCGWLRSQKLMHKWMRRNGTVYVE